MSFTSLEFILYFILLLVIFSLSPVKHRKYIILVASYGFYSWWNWQYTPLLLISTFVDYKISHLIFKQLSERKRKALLWLSILLNIGLLGYFKYHNFFINNINFLLDSGFQLHNLILPIGISFYTFQTLSYSIDVYRNKIKPENSFINFAIFVSFFPQLVAGPIERAGKLLPQIKQFNGPNAKMVKKGFLLVLWGFFVKLVIADNLTVIVEEIFFSEFQYHSLVYIIGSSIFLIKLYADFMGYSEIARGVALCFGVKLSINFRRPFFARSLREFWQRWHITLTGWIGDYVNKPLRENISNPFLKSMIVILVMVLVGFWHGASWNFVMYGAVQGLILWAWLPIARFFKYFFSPNKWLESFFGWLFMYLSVLLVIPMFLISDTDNLIRIFSNIFSYNGQVDSFYISDESSLYAIFGVILLGVVSTIDEFSSRSCYSRVVAMPSFLRWLIKIVLLVLILLTGNFDNERFIYFAF